MRGRLRKAGRTDLVPTGAAVGSCAMGELGAQDVAAPLRFPYEVPAVIDHGPLANLSWARFSGLGARLSRPADGV